uniref:Uncharacterized protein n=1 Tax=Panagrolaimus sp. JU765 TaxID=591449 RepID=A0AC34QLM3_9BILA
MIAEEIVHNSIPEDRIQFATTCKAFNQLVKHAKPKKIIRRLLLGCDCADMFVIINSGNLYEKTLPELKRILPLCQVENLSISAWGGFLDEYLFAELMDLLMEPCRLTDLQQFLLAANFEMGAEIHFRFEKESKTFECFLTIIGNGLFEFQMLRSSGYLILDQQMNNQTKKTLKLSADFYFNRSKDIPFTLTSVSNPDILVFSGELTGKSREKIVSENVVECVKILNPDYPIRYSPKLLDDWFPRTENYDPFERVKTINETLGTNISVIKPEMLEERIRNPALEKLQTQT